MSVPDTPFEVEKALFESYRHMGPQNRSAIGFELSDNMRDISFDSYKSANPTQSEQELQLHFLDIVLCWRIPRQLRSTLVEHGS